MPRNRPEQALHQRVAKMLDLILIDAWWTTIGHGRPGKLQSAILKGMGAKPGVPDLLIVHQGRALFIELKAGQSLSPAQRECHAALCEAKADVFVCRSLEQVLCALDAAGIPHRVVSGYWISRTQNGRGGL